MKLQNKKCMDIVYFYLVNSVVKMGQKMKTHKWAQKRIKITKTGKILFHKAGNNHLLTNKGNNNKAYPYGKVLSTTYKKKIRNLFPSN